MSKRLQRQKAQKWGLWAERVAAVFLQLQFYRIIATRFKSPVGEIDLIAKRGRTIVFVEVKYRRSVTAKTEALEAVNQKRIWRAAQYFNAHNPQYVHYAQRFDVIFLAPWTMPRHMKNAFDGE